VGFPEKAEKERDHPAVLAKTENKINIFKSRLLRSQSSPQPRLTVSLNSVDLQFSVTYFGDRFGFKRRPTLSVIGWSEAELFEWILIV
jgi:hypothetical protein